MDFSSDDPAMGRGHSVHLQEESGLARDRRMPFVKCPEQTLTPPMTIDELPNDVLVKIFFYVNIRDFKIPNPWHALVHVCRRWRYLVFESPRHLNLRLEYSGRQPMTGVLDAWPILPISLISVFDPSNKQWDNTIAALESEHSNRICEISILPSGLTDSQWEMFTDAMQKPFPELTDLRVLTFKEVPVLPDSFLGGSAPRLRTLALLRIPFPSIPKLLLSANRLVRLSLLDIPYSGYFSPDALATALTVMTRLESLGLQFDSPRSHSDPASRPLPPPTRFVLPALTKLMFLGVYGYLEELLAQIDAPLLNDLCIEFFVMDLDFDVPELHRFIGHAQEFKTFDRAHVSISNYSIRLHVYPNTGSVDRRRQLELRINWPEADRQLSSLAQVCSPFLSVIFALEDLQIREDYWFLLSQRMDDMENAQWLEFLDPFTALKNLYLTDGIAQRICGALQEVSGERATEVLPALRNLFVRGSSLEPVQEAMKPFVAARQLSGHPVVVDRWKD